MTTIGRRVLDRLKTLVAERLRQRVLVLFGSRARGAADPDAGT